VEPTASTVPMTIAAIVFVMNEVLF